jgi:hypothetical protein
LTPGRLLSTPRGMKRVAIALLGCFLIAIAACGGGHPVGEECGTPGSTGDCTDNAICGWNAVGRLVCEQICVKATDCGMGSDCAPVAGSSSFACKQK